MPAEFIYIFGDSGSGKSHYVESLHPYDTIFRKNNLKWWDGYNPEEHTVIHADNYKPSSASVLISLLHSIADNPPLMEIRYGRVRPTFTHLYITNRRDPWSINPKGEDAYRIFWRITKLIECFCIDGVFSQIEHNPIEYYNRGKK